MSIVIIPAYGRDYNSIWEARDAVLSGVDFKIVKGPHCSIRDFKSMKIDFESIVLHFNGLTMKTDVTDLKQP